ncbi:MAG: DUF2202 domain-containing protein [Pseudomonadota bacterium]
MKATRITQHPRTGSMLAVSLCSAVLVSTAAAAGKGGHGLRIDAASAPLLDGNEAAHLTFMREEEKLARDVYLSLAGMYPEQAVFSTIATRSEQTHTDTMRDRLEQYGLPDPNPDANNLPGSVGVFSGVAWGWYFAEKYQALVSKGAESELAALYVGALIEELDMHDIAECPQVMVDAGYSDPCGLHYTDETALRNAYRSLIDGSENHLRAFVGQIEAVIGAGNYVAQYLSQEEVDAILGR